MVKQQQAEGEDTPIPDTTLYLTKGEVARLREFNGQAEGARAVANAAVEMARQVSRIVDAEMEGLKSHYGVAKNRRTTVDLDNGSMKIHPVEETETEV